MQKHAGTIAMYERQKILLYVREHLATSNVQKTIDEWREPERAPFSVVNQYTLWN